MKTELLVVGMEILGIGPVTRGSNELILPEVIYPLHVLPNGWEIVEAELPPGFAVQAYQWFGAALGVMPRGTQTDPLADLRQERSTEIEAQRQAASLQPLPYGDVALDCTQASQALLQALATSLSQYGSLPPLFSDQLLTTGHSLMPADAEAIEAIIGALAARDAANYARAQSLKAQIAEAATAEQITAVAW